jgi:hypothetical protein
MTFIISSRIYQACEIAQELSEQLMCLCNKQIRMQEYKATQRAVGGDAAANAANATLLLLRPLHLLQGLLLLLLAVGPDEETQVLMKHARRTQNKYTWRTTSTNVIHGAVADRAAYPVPVSTYPGMHRLDEFGAPRDDAVPARAAQPHPWWTKDSSKLSAMLPSPEAPQHPLGVPAVFG